MHLFKEDKENFTKDFNQMIKIGMINSLGFFFIGFLIPIVARTEMNATAFQISIIVSLNVLVRTFSSVITGYITDKIKSKTNLLMFGSFGRCMVYVIFYISFVSSNLYLLLIGNTTLGFIAGIFWVPFRTLVSEKSNKESRSYAFGKTTSLNIAGQVIGAILGFLYLTITKLIIQDPAILYLPILLFGVANIIGGITFKRKVDESITFDYDESDEVNVKMKTTSRFMLIGVIFLMIMLFLSSVNATMAKPFLGIYLLENIESNVNLVYWVYFPAGILGTFLSPQIGKIIDRVRPLISITVISILGALMTYLLINSNNILIFGFLLVFDLAIGMSLNIILSNILSRVSIIHRGKIFGAGDFFQFLGNTFGPLLGGIAWDNLGPKAPFLITIIIELCLIPVYLFVIYFLLPNLTEKFNIKKIPM